MLALCFVLFRNNALHTVISTRPMNGQTQLKAECAVKLGDGAALNLFELHCGIAPGNIDLTNGVNLTSACVGVCCARICWDWCHILRTYPRHAFDTHAPEKIREHEIVERISTTRRKESGPRCDNFPSPQLPLLRCKLRRRPCRFHCCFHHWLDPHLNTHAHTHLKMIFNWQRRVMRELTMLVWQMSIGIYHKRLITFEAVRKKLFWAGVQCDR